MDRQKHIEKIKKELAKRLARKLKKLEKGRKNYTPPRYDEVYFEGLKWLDGLD